MIGKTTIILNGKIYTVDSKNTVKEALVIEDDKILYVGNNEDIKGFIDKAITSGKCIEFVDFETFMNPEEDLNEEVIRVIDLEGRVLLPSFTDSHIHPPGTAITDLYEVSLYGLNSVEECKEAIRSFIEKNKDIDAVYGKGWSLGIFEGEEVSKGPKKEHLDEVSTEIPIILRAYDGHTLWLNSKAFEKFNITNDTNSPSGGKIEINDNTKELWGTLKESATHLVKEGEYTNYQYKKAFELFQQKMHKFGVTSILSLSGFEWGIQPEVYSKLIEEDNLKMRVSAGFSISPDLDLKNQIEMIKNRKDKFDSKYFKTTTVKFLADGVVEGVTASLTKPYEIGAGKGDNYYGDILWNENKLVEVIKLANEKGFSIHVHSVGDNATKSMLDAIEKANYEINQDYEKDKNDKNLDCENEKYLESINYESLDCENEKYLEFINYESLDCISNKKLNYRNALTHLQLVRNEDIKRFKDLNVIASVQPYWHMKGPNWWDVVDYKLLGDRANYEYPLNSFVKESVKIASSSDHSVTPIPNPFFAIQAGVTRNLYNASYFGAEDVKDMDEEAWLLNKDERVTVEDMVRSFTINGAYLIFRDNEIGSIEAGKYADFIVIDRDIFEINPVDIGNTQVLMTFFDGKMVYKSN